MDTLKRFNISINNCRSQCYDGASAMAGDISGLKTRIMQTEHRALFVHCRSHSLNLVVQAEVSRNTDIANTMSLVQNFIAFARGSPKRLAWFHNFQDQNDNADANGTSFRPFCPTRFIMRKISIISITSNYSSLIEWLQDLETNEDFVKCKAEAAGFLASFQRFDTFFKLEMLRQIFTTLEDANTQLQGAQLNFQRAEAVIEALKKVFIDARSEERFDVLWTSAEASAKFYDLDEPELPRQRRPPARRTGSAAAYFPSTPKEMYRKIYFAAYDGVIVGLSDRFEPSSTTTHLKKVEEFLIGKTGVEYLEEFYQNDFEDYQRLLLHRNIALDAAKSEKKEIKDFQDFLDFLKMDHHMGIRSLASEVVKLVKIVLTMAVTTCTAERSYSGLRRLKSYLRSTMTQKRLNAVALLNTHRDIVKTFELDVLLDNFIAKVHLRMRTFSMSNATNGKSNVKPIDS